MIKNNYPMIFPFKYLYIAFLHFNIYTFSTIYTQRGFFMIREMWYAVLSSKELKKGKVNAFLRFGEKLILWRNEDNSIACIADLCAHRGASLSLGKLQHSHVQCPFHGIEYDSKGKAVLIPANGKNAPIPEYFKVNAYPCVERHGFIWIYWGDKKEDIGEPVFFKDIPEDFSYSEVSDPWPVQYSRVIENQLDVVHLPFVHHNTIGKGNKTIVNGPVEKIEGNSLEIFVYNEVDSGQSPKKASDLPKPSEKRQHLHFIFPNIWQNYITEKLRVTAFFVPVDDENAIIYLRFYQNFMKVPGIKHLIHAVGNRMNFIVQRQDRRIVSTQLPKKSALKMQEKLIPGDSPIITYRKMRDALQKAQGENSKS